MAMVTVMFQGETVGSHTIKHYPFVVGRDAENDVHIDNIGVSRQHCQFIYDNGHFNIQDLESANGTHLHGQKIRMAPIRDGDEIKMGKYTLVFHQAPGEGPPPPKDGAPAPAAATPGAEEKPGQKGTGFTGERTLMVQGAAFAAPGTESAGPQRASEVAKKFQPAEKAGSGKGIWILVVFMAVIVVGLVATVAALILSRS